MSPRRAAVVLEDPNRAQLLDALRAGNARDTAARYVGLGPDELAELLERDLTLARDVAAAEASVEVGTVAGMASAAKKGDWRAGEALLKRRVMDPAKLCGARRKHGGGTCTHGKGQATDHPGFGNCKWHGGGSPKQKPLVDRERAAASIAKLGIPLGNGNPFDLLEQATKYSAGYLEATAQLLVDIVDAKRADVTLEAAARLHVDAIRQGAMTGHQAVTANVADRQARISEAMSNIVLAAIQTALDVAGVTTPEIRDLASAAAAEILEARVPVGAELN